ILPIPVSVVLIHPRFRKPRDASVQRKRARALWAAPRTQGRAPYEAFLDGTAALQKNEDSDSLGMGRVPMSKARPGGGSTWNRQSNGESGLSLRMRLIISLQRPPRRRKLTHAKRFPRAETANR